MRKWIKVFYIKWILKQCRHLCIFCEYRNDCYYNLEYEYEQRK